MNVTKELREWAEDNTLQDIALTTYPPQHTVHGVLETLLRIADRIDAEYQKAEDEWKVKNGQSWLNGYAECHAELMEGNEAITANLKETGWVKLPMDIDGVPINIGDVMAYEDNTKPMEVVALVPPVIFLTEDGPRYANMCRHYHAPTVEDVLREFANEVYADADNEIRDRDFICAKYAKRLQLQEDVQ